MHQTLVYSCTFAAVGLHVWYQRHALHVCSSRSTDKTKAQQQVPITRVDFSMKKKRNQNVILLWIFKHNRLCLSNMNALNINVCPSFSLKLILFIFPLFLVFLKFVLALVFCPLSDYLCILHNNLLQLLSSYRAGSLHCKSNNFTIYRINIWKRVLKHKVVLSMQTWAELLKA